MQPYEEIEKWGDSLFDTSEEEFLKDEKVLLRINELDLNEEISSQATWYGWYGVLEAQATSQLETYKYALDVYGSYLSNRLRIDFNNKGERLTEGKLENLLFEDGEYQRITEKILSTKRDVNVITAFRKALEHRLQMIITLSANKRKEQIGE